MILVIMNVEVLITNIIVFRGRHGRACMVDGFITTYAISAYHH